MSTENGTESTVEYVALGSIKRDQRVNTRPIDQGWVERRANEGFDWRKFGVPVVSERPNGTYVWLDGQNRGALAREAGVERDHKVSVSVFRGLTRSQEAEIFLGLNEGRTVAPVYKYLGKVAAGDPETVAIDKILRKNGWKVSPGNSADGAAHAVSAYEQVYRIDRTGDVLDVTVAVISAAWAHRYESMRAVIVKGIAAVIHRYGVEMNVGTLVTHLQMYKGGALGLYADARGLHSYRGGSIANAVSEVVVNAYNKKRRGSSRISEWGAK